MNPVCLFQYCLHLADNTLVLAQRNSEWCGHGPALEPDIAITNISLDLLGQTRYLYQYTSDLHKHCNKEEKAEIDVFLPHLWKTFNRELNEDDLAFLRDEHQYFNLLLVELPKGDWAQTILRQFFFSTFQFHQYKLLQQSRDAQLAAIAEKAVKEVAYHLRWSSEWVIRLGNGTEESNLRIKKALDELWSFTGEMFMPAIYERNTVKERADVTLIKDEWLRQVQSVFAESNLQIPEAGWMQSGGKQGRHTEYFGYMLSEMQFLQRAYPDSIW